MLYRRSASFDALAVVMRATLAPLVLLGLAGCAGNAVLGTPDGAIGDAPRDGVVSLDGRDGIAFDGNETMDGTSPLDGTGDDGASTGDGAPNTDASDDTLFGDGGPNCGNGHVDPGETCDDGNANPFDGCLPDCTRPVVIGPPDRTWTYYTIPGTQCVDGSPAGFGVSTVAGSTNLMMYLEGGGACFNDACDFTALSVPFVPPPDGIFNRTNSANPVRDWNMIYVPYCSGDIYGGDRDTILGGATRHFHGWRNIGRFLESIVPAFPSVTRVLVTGISAGGFGSGLNAGRIADAFDTTGPARTYALIDDSGPPFGNEVIPPCLQQIFRNVWGLDDTIIRYCGSDCPDPNNFASGVLHHLDRTHPTMPIGLFSNVGDTVIRTFMGAGWGNGMRNDCTDTPVIVPISAYQDGLLAMRTTYMTRGSFYFIGITRPPDFGLGHTVLRSPSYYLTSIDGTSVPEWVADVLAGRITQVGP